MALGANTSIDSAIRSCRPADGVAQVALPVRRLAEQVAPVAVEQAQMDVQPAAALLGERLGHEGGALPGRPRRGLDAALEHGALVRRQHHVVDMAEIDLELAGRELGQGSLDRQVLRLAVALHQLEEGLLILDPLRREHLGLGRATAKPGRSAAPAARHARPSSWSIR